VACEGLKGLSGHGRGAAVEDLTFGRSTGFLCNNTPDSLAYVRAGDTINCLMPLMRAEKMLE
jgi:hypothetical protein